MIPAAQDSTILPQRAVALAAIAGLHVLVIFLIASGFASRTIIALMPRTVAVVLDEAHPTEPPPPPPADPDLVRPVIDIGPPPLVGDPPPDDGGTTLTAPFVPPTQPYVPPVAQPVEPIHLVGKHRLPNTEDYYPADLIRRGIEGATTVRVCVDEKGKLKAAPTVDNSSGNGRLDEAAISVAKDGRYARSAQGDTFVPNCYGFRIIFQISGH